MKKLKTNKKAPSINKLIKKLDAVYSTYVRSINADFNGYVACYTCGVKKHWKDQQCGHYVSRAVKSLRFDQRNTKVQCVGCNIFKHGALDEYALALQKEYGEGILKELNQTKNQSKRYTVLELQGLIQFYTDYGIQK